MGSCVVGLNVNALKRTRKFLGFTQGQMASALGVSRATYQRRERLAEDYVTTPERVYVEGLVGAKAVEDVFRGGARDDDEG